MSTTPQSPSKALPMFAAHEQLMQRGSANASATNVPTTGLFDAMLTLHNDVFSLLGEKPQPDVAITESLDPYPLAQVADRRLASHDELADPGTSPAELHGWLQLLKNIRARKPMRAHREARACVKEIVTEKCRSVMHSVQQAVGEAPHRAKELLEVLRYSVESITWPEPSAEPLTRLEHAVKGMSIRQEHGGQLAKSTLEFLMAQLPRAAVELTSQCRKVVAMELVVEELKEAIRSLLSFLDEQGRFASQFTRRTETLRQLFEQRRQQGLESQDYSRASVILDLPGKTEAEIFAGIIERAQVRDRRSFVLRFIERLNLALSEEAVTESTALADGTSLGQLLVRLAPGRIADVFERLFEESLGEGHSLYEIVEKFGIEKLVADLLGRAEPLCHLNHRDIPQFNVTPVEHTVVRLPLPSGPRDKHIRTQVEVAFQRVTHCTVLDSAPGERDAITVTKVKVGWPLVIEAGNADLLMHYSRCDDLGHLPHLIGVLPFSKNGQAIGGYVDLARQLKSSQVCP